MCAVRTSIVRSAVWNEPPGKLGASATPHTSLSMLSWAPRANDANNLQALAALYLVLALCARVLVCVCCSVATLEAAGMADHSGFAGAVVLGDLDDFIAPSQSCVNPIIATDVADASAKLDSGVQQGMAKISLDSGVFSGLPCVLFRLRFVAYPLHGMCSLPQRTSEAT